MRGGLELCGPFYGGYVTFTAKLGEGRVSTLRLWAARLRDVFGSFLNKGHPSAQVPWWNRRTSMERRFVVLVGVLSILVLCLGVGLVLMVRGHRIGVSTTQVLLSK